MTSEHLRYAAFTRLSRVGELRLQTVFTSAFAQNTSLSTQFIYAFFLSFENLQVISVLYSIFAQDTHSESCDYYYSSLKLLVSNFPQQAVFYYEPSICCLSEIVERLNSSIFKGS